MVSESRVQACGPCMCWASWMRWPQVQTTAAQRLQLLRWPRHWREQPGLCPATLTVQGALSDAQMEDIAREHLAPRTLPGLRHRIQVLRELMGEDLDSDELAVLLGIAPEEAQAAMGASR